MLLNQENSNCFDPSILVYRNLKWILFIFLSLRNNASFANDALLRRDGLPQYLPIEAQYCKPNFYCIEFEVANTSIEKKIGLMFRPKLRKGRGMLFNFDRPRVVKIWTYKTLYPIDIVFLLDRYVVSIQENIPPCFELPCNNYGPKKIIDQVLELSAGEVDYMQIRVGDEINIHTINF